MLGIKVRGPVLQMLFDEVWAVGAFNPEAEKDQVICVCFRECDAQLVKEALEQAPD